MASSRIPIPTFQALVAYSDNPGFAADQLRTDEGLLFAATASSDDSATKQFQEDMSRDIYSAQERSNNNPPLTHIQRTVNSTTITDSSLSLLASNWNQDNFFPLKKGITGHAYCTTTNRADIEGKYSLYTLAQVPQNDLTKYIDCYILAGEDLYYINDHKSAEKIVITNPDSFKQCLEQLLRQINRSTTEYSIPLSVSDIEELIEKNSTHQAPTKKRKISSQMVYKNSRLEIHTNASLRTTRKQQPIPGSISTTVHFVAGQGWVFSGMSTTNSALAQLIPYGNLHFTQPLLDTLVRRAEREELQNANEAAQRENQAQAIPAQPPRQEINQNNEQATANNLDLEQATALYDFIKKMNAGVMSNSSGQKQLTILLPSFSDVTIDKDKPNEITINRFPIAFPRSSEIIGYIEQSATVFYKKDGGSKTSQGTIPYQILQENKSVDEEKIAKEHIYPALLSQITPSLEAENNTISTIQAAVANNQFSYLEAIKSLQLIKLLAQISDIATAEQINAIKTAIMDATSNKAELIEALQSFIYFKNERLATYRYLFSSCSNIENETIHNVFANLAWKVTKQKLDKLMGELRQKNIENNAVKLLVGKIVDDEITPLITRISGDTHMSIEDKTYELQKLVAITWMTSNLLEQTTYPELYLAKANGLERDEDVQDKKYPKLISAMRLLVVHIEIQKALDTKLSVNENINLAERGNALEKIKMIAATMTEKDRDWLLKNLLAIYREKPNANALIGIDEVEFIIATITLENTIRNIRESEQAPHLSALKQSAKKLLEWAKQKSGNKDSAKPLADFLNSITNIVKQLSKDPATIDIDEALSVIDACYCIRHSSTSNPNRVTPELLPLPDDAGDDDAMSIDDGDRVNVETEEKQSIKEDKDSSPSTTVIEEFPIITVDYYLHSILDCESRAEFKSRFEAFLSAADTIVYTEARRKLSDLVNPSTQQSAQQSTSPTDTTLQQTQQPTTEEDGIYHVKKQAAQTLLRKCEKFINNRFNYPIFTRNKLAGVYDYVYTDLVAPKAEAITTTNPTQDLGISASNTNTTANNLPTSNPHQPTTSSQPKSLSQTQQNRFTDTHQLFQEDVENGTAIANAMAKYFAISWSLTALKMTGAIVCLAVLSNPVAAIVCCALAAVAFTAGASVVAVSIFQQKRTDKAHFISSIMEKPGQDKTRPNHPVTPRKAIDP